MKSLERLGIRPGLERMEFLLSELGNPQNSQRIIHVAGTNGKGSTAAMLAAILQAAGYDVGLFTSPHLQDYRERIRRNGQLITEHELSSCLEVVRPLAEEAERRQLGHPTEFELVTTCMYVYFQRNKVDILIQETGLGGTWDSTNVVSRPLLAIVTNIGLDHQHILGKRLEDIAAQKAGIIKPNTHVLSAKQHREVTAVLRDRAEQVNASLEFVPPALRSGQDGLNGQWIEIPPLKQLYLPLLGKHQLQNAALAVRAALWCSQNGFSSVDTTTIRDGLRAVRWPGRMELIERPPNHPLLMLDGAHNLAAARVLAEQIRELKIQPVLLLGMLNDKDVAATAAELIPLCTGLVLTSPGSSRALQPHELYEKIAYLCTPSLPVVCKERPGEALQQAEVMAGPDGFVLAAGSLYLVGVLRDLLHLPV